MTTAITTTNNTASVSAGNFNQGMVADWLAFNADKSPATVTTYAKALKNFFAFLDANKIVNPTRQDIINYREQLCATKSVSTARLYVVAVKNFFKWAASCGLYLDVAAGVKSPSLAEEGETHSREPLTLNQAKSVLSSFEGKTDEKSLRDSLIMRIMLNCGLRSVEVVRLDTADIEKKHGKIFLKIWGKGRSGKTALVEIPASVHKMILDYLNLRGAKFKAGEPMFVSTSNRTRGQRLQTQSISRMAKQTFRSVGIDSPSITCHSARHTCATVLLCEGHTDIRRVQKLLRHKSVVTTERYAADMRQASDNTVGILDALFVA